MNSLFKPQTNVTPYIISFLTFVLILTTGLNTEAQKISDDLARYMPEWIRDGFADAGATHEPWLFQTRRNRSNFNQWQKEEFDYQ